MPDKDVVLKHKLSTRVMHGVHALSFLVLLITGIGFYFHIAVIDNIFGGAATASVVHRTAAVIFTVVPLFYILTNWDSFARFVDTISTFGRDEWQWLKVSGGYLPFIKGEVPPQDKYNAGQKILGLLIIFGCFLFIVTGYPMWFLRHTMSPVLMNICYTVHAWDALILGLAVLGHFFLAAIYPPSRVEFSSMMTNGLVDAEYTAHHNGKWYKKLSRSA